MTHVYLNHHWSAWTGDWYHGVCNACGWWGKELRDPDKARKWMENHRLKCTLRDRKWSAKGWETVKSERV